MSTDFTLEYRRKYIHARLGADYQITPEGMAEFWPALTVACKKYKCRRVLSEGSVSKRHMSTMNAFQSAMKASQIIRGLSLACCFYDYAPDELSDFFKAVAKHRGARVEFFSNRKQALEWLGVRPAEDSDEGDA